MAQLKVKTNTQELVSSKFVKTIAVIYAELNEANNRYISNTDYNASGVQIRMQKIKNAFEKDLQNLIKDIEIS